MGDRHGRGFFDCPVEECEETIVGSYGELLAHVESKHPLDDLFVDEELKSVTDRIKEAQKEALEKDIREKLVVDSDE